MCGNLKDVWRCPRVLDIDQGNQRIGGRGDQGDIMSAGVTRGDAMAGRPEKDYAREVKRRKSIVLTIEGRQINCTKSQDVSKMSAIG